MAKVIVTNELVDLIRSIRIEKKLTAKKISQTLKKSDSYIAKLEAGKIKTLSMEDLESIIAMISDGDKDIESVLEVAYNRLKVKYNSTEIENQLWFYNFDTVGRIIPVPESFCNEINDTLTANSISIDTLVMHINANEFMPKEIASNKEYPFNEWFSYRHADGTSDVYIKMKVDTEDVRDILQRKIIAASYVVFLAIALYTLRYSKGNDPLDEEKKDQLTTEARTFLRKHRIYKYIEKKEIRESVSEDQKPDFLSTDDLEVMQELSEIRDLLYLYSDLDVNRAKKQLHVIKKNLEWDAPFIASLMATEFFALGELCSYTVKKDLITELRTVFKKYIDMPEKQRKIESYTD